MKQNKSNDTYNNPCLVQPLIYIRWLLQDNVGNIQTRKALDTFLLEHKLGEIFFSGFGTFKEFAKHWVHKEEHKSFLSYAKKINKFR